MAAYSSSLVLDRLNSGQGKPLLQKCYIMEDILSTISTKDLRPSLPLLLHEIFDFEKDSNQGWQLDLVFRSHNYELFSRLLSLLGPEGPLMKLVNSLQTDPQALYEFPLKSLPTPSRHMIEEGAIPSFYANKLHGHNFTSAVLMLNAFELFMFHMAHALVSPNWRLRSQGWGDLFEFIYPEVIERYLEYFLPCDKSSLPSVPFSSTSLRTSIGSISPNRSYNPPSPQHPGSPHSPTRPSLFKTSFINAQKQHQQSLPVFDQAEAEIWRSETFLQVIAEFWLNQNSMSGNDIASFGTLKFPAFYRRDPLRSMLENVMPTLNQVKMVRLLVKYTHHFANSASSAINSPYQSHVQSPLDQFKRSVIPHLLQKKVYTFLRHAFDRWPLDSGFRLIMETWLSYIQPWRYTDYRNRLNVDAQHSDTDLSKYVDDKWDEFVEENLLFYTVITSEFLPRVHRLDLTAPHSAYMVYRVSRILSLPNLSNLIYKAEQELFGGLSRQADLGGSYLSGHAAFINSLPSQMMDLEGPNFQYISFFSDTMKFNITSVVDQVAQALESVRRQNDKVSSGQQNKRNAGFFASLFGTSDYSDSSGLSTSERKRMSGHLEYTIHNFCTIFCIPKPAIVTEFPDRESTHNTSTLSNGSMYLAEEDSTMPECIETEQGLKLTDLGRLQLINKERKFEKFDLGDPDLQPVRSYENATLVRLLFHFCAFINSYFSTEFSNAFYRRDFVGHFARVFLTPPSSPQSKMPSYRSSYLAYGRRSHQPRISLRFLASYRSIIHFSIVYMLQYFFVGFGPMGFIIIALILVGLYGVLVASFHTLTGKTPNL